MKRISKDARNAARETTAAKDASILQWFARTFKKPKSSIDPTSSESTHRTIAIIAGGGTFLTSDKVKPRKPQYHKNLAEFIKASNLTDYFKSLQLYEKDGKYFLPDGTEIVYKPFDPSIDSTNARYKERHKIASTIRELQDQYPQVDVMVIHGTDTAAQTAQFLDLQFGRDADIGIAIVSSQDPADAKETDATGQFKTGFKALYEKKFRQVFVVPNNGQEIFSGITAKITDVLSGIYTGTLIGRCDHRSKITSLLKPALGAGQKPERVKIPRLESFAQAIIKNHTPHEDGEQEIQVENAAIDIINNRKGNPRLRFVATVLRMAGSGNLPDYADPILDAVDNRMPIFAISEVPGAITVDENGIPKYAASVLQTASEKNLNNLIILPATRPGIEMRPSSIIALAATYARPHTPEFLLLCQVFASFAWTPEDWDDKSPQITGNRQDLIELRETLDEAFANLPASLLPKVNVSSGGDIEVVADGEHTGENTRVSLKTDPLRGDRQDVLDSRNMRPKEYLYDPTQKILIDPDCFDQRASLALQNARVARLLKKHTPNLVDADGHYRMQDIYNSDGNVVIDRILRVNPGYYGPSALRAERPEARVIQRSSPTLAAA